MSHAVERHNRIRTTLSKSVSMKESGPENGGKNHPAIRPLERLLIRLSVPETVDRSEMGDFLEIFCRIERGNGAFKARMWLYKQIGRSLVLRMVQLIRFCATLSIHHIRLMFRNMQRQPGTSLISLAGLALGIAFSILSMLFIRQETGFDRFHSNERRIALVQVQFESEKEYKRKPSGATPPILAPTLMAHIPEMEKAACIYGWHTIAGIPIRAGERSFMHSGLYADPEFLQMFSFPILAGDPNTALQDPHSILITPGLAERFFDTHECIGKVLTLRLESGERDLRVSGVIDVPEESSIRFDFLIPKALLTHLNDRWGSNCMYTFILIREGFSFADVEKKCNDFFDLFFQGMRSTPYRVTLIPLRSLYLNTKIREWLTVQSDPVYSAVMGTLSVLIVIIACVNYINLSMGLLSNRWKEIGLRKVMGSGRRQTVIQILGESMFLMILAMAVGVILAWFAVPWFGKVLNRTVPFDLKSIALPLLALSGFVAMAAGIYPAFILSGFQPASIFRGSQRIGRKNRISRLLILIQFSAALMLIVSMLVMSRQIRHLRNRKLGFDPEQVLIIDCGGRGTGLNEEKIRSLLEKLRQQSQGRPGIVSMTMSNMSFGTPDIWSFSFESGGENKVCVTCAVDYDYTKTLGMSIVGGRDFSMDFPADRANSVLINRKFASFLGWDDPVGRLLPFEWGDLPMTIIGVVEDSHFKDFRHEIDPAVFHLQEINGGGYRYLFIRMGSESIRQNIDWLQSIWRVNVPERPFLYRFMDEDVEEVFRQDTRWAEIIQASAVLAILLACLGAVGLTSIHMAARRKEVAIRKVVGASDRSLVLLLIREFLLLVSVANLVAGPLVYWLLSRWLRNFIFRIRLTPVEFTAAGLFLAFLILSSVSGLVFKTARENPVKALKYE